MIYLSLLLPYPYLLVHPHKSTTNLAAMVNSPKVTCLLSAAALACLGRSLWQVFKLSEYLPLAQCSGYSSPFAGLHSFKRAATWSSVHCSHPPTLGLPYSFPGIVERAVVSCPVSFTNPQSHEHHSGTRLLIVCRRCACPPCIQDCRGPNYDSHRG